MLTPSTLSSERDWSQRARPTPSPVFTQPPPMAPEGGLRAPADSAEVSVEEAEEESVRRERGAEGDSRELPLITLGAATDCSVCAGTVPLAVTSTLLSADSRRGARGMIPSLASVFRIGRGAVPEPKVDRSVGVRTPAAGAAEPAVLRRP